MRDAATLAGPAIMARRTAAVRCGEDRDPADRDNPLESEPLGDAVPDHLLGAVQRHGRKELAVRELRQAERLARNPDELLHVVVPRRDVGVADRPVHAESVPRVRLEVEVAPAVYLPAPHDRLATHLAAADPMERLVGIERVRVLAVVHEELAAVLVAGITMALDELIALERRAVAEAAELHLPRRHVLDVIARRVDRPASSTRVLSPRSHSSLAAHPPVMPDPTTMASKLGTAIRSPPGTRASGPARCTRCTSPGSPRNAARRSPPPPTCSSRTPSGTSCARKTEAARRS